MKKKIFALVAVVIVAAAAVSGTLAYLTATPTALTNTFTVGDIQAKLEETNITGAGKTTDGNEYKNVLPGGSVDKDPTVTVLAGSVDCYVYVCVENTMLIDGEVVATPNFNTSDWTRVGDAFGNKVLYRYYTLVETLDDAQELPAVFTKVTFDGEAITMGNKAELENGKIIVSAYVHQAEGIAELDTIDDYALTWAETST